MYIRSRYRAVARTLDVLPWEEGKKCWFPTTLLRSRKFIHFALATLEYFS